MAKVELYSGGKPLEVRNGKLVTTPDGDSDLVAHAIDVILKQYGDTVSVSEKRKDLLKFGAVDSTVGTSEQTIMELQGSEIRETYATSNSVDAIITDDTGTNTNQVVIEGHTIANNKLTFVVQTANLNTQTKVSLSTPLARATRAYFPGASSFNAASKKVYIYDSTVAATPASGVPNDATATKLIINSVDNQSEKCATSISATDYWIISRVYAGAGLKANADGVVRLRSRTVPNVFRTIGPKIFLDAAVASQVVVDFVPYLIIPSNSDVELTFQGSVSGISVTGGINGYLASIVR